MATWAHNKFGTLTLTLVELLFDSLIFSFPTCPPHTQGSLHIRRPRLRIPVSYPFVSMWTFVCSWGLGFRTKICRSPVCDVVACRCLSINILSCNHDTSLCTKLIPWWVIVFESQILRCVKLSLIKPSCWFASTQIRDIKWVWPD